MALDVIALLKLALLADGALKRYRNSNPSRSLDRAVRHELETDTAYGPRVREELINQWFYVHDDPRGAVLIAGYLSYREPAYLDALRLRIGEMLSALETLPLDEVTVADRLVRAVRNNIATAQKDNRQAIQAGTTAVVSTLDALPDELAERIEGIVGERLEAGHRERRPVLVTAAGLREDDQRPSTSLPLPTTRQPPA